jgi:hypothetical protein
MPIKGHATDTATQVIQLIGLCPKEMKMNRSLASGIGVTL